tara:strand:+ start:16221 stop:16961 length:741 start_codon:yes stop_codon:yes gene_type:complete
MPNIVLVPARSGSKRFINKNAKPLLNLPLFLWTIRAAANSKRIDRIIFSTDSDEYVNLCLSDASKRNYKISIDKRTEKEAGDKVKIYDYIKSQTFLSRNNIKENDNLILLLPTCPLRPKCLIDEVIEISTIKEKTVFTCCEYDFHVSFAFSLNIYNEFDPLLGDKSPLKTGFTRSQDQEVFYRPNGSVVSIPYINLINPEASSIYFNSLAFKMEKIFSCDVDTEEQLKIAIATAELVKEDLEHILN